MINLGSVKHTYTHTTHNITYSRACIVKSLTRWKCLCTFLLQVICQNPVRDYLEVGFGEMTRSQRWNSHELDYCYYKRDPRKLFHSLPPREDTARRWTSECLQVVSHQTQVSAAAFDLRLPSLQNCEKQMSVKSPGL